MLLGRRGGWGIDERVLDVHEEHFRRTTEVNYLGYVWMMQAAVPGMMRRGSGHVVNMCSPLGRYAAGKARKFYSVTVREYTLMTPSRKRGRRERWRTCGEKWCSSPGRHGGWAS